MEPADHLKTYRAMHGLSQQQVAKKLGISRQMIGFLETREREFTADMAVLIEEKLGIPREDVLPELFRRRAAA